MGLSTHVLDTMHGRPASGMGAALYSLDGDRAMLVRRFELDDDGRCPGGPLLSGEALRKGRYRLVFSVGAYFRGRGVNLPEPAFLEEVTLDFGIADPHQHYHVPLLATPWSYSTYRGS